MNKIHQFIIENYSKMANREIAEILGLKEDSIKTIASRLGVNKYYTTPDLFAEVWRVHSEYPKYLISNKGRVKSKVRNKLIFTRVHERYYDCRLKNEEGINKTLRIHRLVAEVFLESVEGKNIVNHIDGDKLNNNVENLEWSTDKENSQHAIRMGLIGSRTDTLEESEVHNICKLLQEGKSYSQILPLDVRYTRSRVEKIRQRRRWIKISENYKW